MSRFWIKFDLHADLGRKTMVASVIPLTVLASSVASAHASTQLVQLQMQPPAALQQSMLVSHKAATDTLHLAVSLASPNPAGLTAFADSVNNPHSVKYHKWATPAQLGLMFGQPAATVQAVVTYLKSKGFNVKLVGASHLMILADATVAQAESAFNTTINNYHLLNSSIMCPQDYYSFSEPVHAPATFASAIKTICGLESTSMRSPMLKKNVTVAAMASLSKRRFNSAPLTPQQTRTLYGVAPMWANGFKGDTAHLAISNWDGYRLSNVPLYYSQFNLPVPPGGVGSNITIVTIDGGSGAGTAQGEGDLDIQMSLGMSPLSSFSVYDGSGIDLVNVLTKEQEDNTADVISESWGWSLPASTVEAAHTEHTLMSAQGQTYMVASGDYGTVIEQTYNYPGYDPDVTLVGGTIANTDSAGNRLSETGWSGSGGGWATVSVPFNTLPSWQTGSGVPTAFNYRLVPDIALHAFADVGAYQFYTGGVLTFDADGTSFASPVCEGSFGVMEQQIVAFGGTRRQGRINDTVYAQNGRSDVWFDITSGSNGTLPSGTISTCTPFWDTVTGWGAPNFLAYAQSVAVSPPQFLGVASVNPYDNTQLSKPVIEGTNEIGSASSLAAGSGYSLLAVDEPAIGEVATAQATFGTTPIGASNPIDNTKIRSLSFSYSGSVSPQATIMLYVLDQTTGKANSGKFVWIKSISGTAFGSPSTVALSKAQLAEFVPASGSIQVLVRYLVPNDRLTQVNDFTFNLSSLQMSVVLALN